MSVKLRRRLDGSFTLERPEFYVQTGSMFENPHGVPPDEIVRMIAEEPPEVVAQVVFGKYVESSGLVFIGELINQLFERDFVVRGSTWMDERVRQQAAILFERQRSDFNNRFFTGIDFARQTDFTVIFTIDTVALPARVVYYRRLNRVPWDDIYAEVGKARMLFGPNILCDSTGMGGDVVMDALHSSAYCPKHHCVVKTGSRCLDEHGDPLDCDRSKYLALSCCDGYEFGGGIGEKKRRLVEHLRNILSVGYNAARRNDGEFGWLRCPSIPVLEEELAFYTWEDRKLQTDALFALALAVWNGLEEPVQDAIIGSPLGRRR